MSNPLVKVWQAAKSLLTGHGITMQEFFKKPIAVRYPQEKLEAYPKGLRGIPALKVNRETGELNCTACGLCARACPVNVITVEAMVDPETGKKKQYPAIYELDYTRCLVCNYCIEACPFDSLEMSDLTELSAYTVDDLVFDRDRLAEIWKRSNAIRIAGGEKI